MKPSVIKMTGQRVYVVDYLKGFSIFTIALMHVINMMSSIPPIIDKLAAVGGSGVHIFFFCSGLGLYGSYLRKKQTFPFFIKKRFFKIYLPYIAVVFLSFLLPWMYTDTDRIQALLSHVFLYKMFIPKYEESFGVQFWFISTILQFYLLFIPLCKIKEKLKSTNLFLGLCLLVSICWWIFCYLYGVSNVRVWSSFCLQYLWEFALGFAVAEKLNNGETITLKNLPLLVTAIAGICLQAGMALFSENLKVFNDIPAFAGYLSLALLIMHIPFFRKAFLMLATFSFEYFLVHKLVFSSLFYLIQPQGLIMQSILAVLVIALAMLAGFFYSRLRLGTVPTLQQNKNGGI